MSDTTTHDLLAFVCESPTPYHAVAAALRRLEAAGFRTLDERDSFEHLTGGKYAVRRGESALIAFVLPERTALRGFRIVGAHTDSPNLRLKPKAEYAKEGYVQLGVEVYGGALLNSWVDRDLGIAGRVFLRDGDTVTSRLVHIDRPIARVAQLAIHLDRDVNERGLVLHRQEHLPPILGLVSSGQETADGGARAAGEWLTTIVATELGVERNAIDFVDLMLADTTPPTLGGANGEFLFSPRLDNLAMCHAAISALAASAEAVGTSGYATIAVLFDHEEVGSQSAYGAGAPLLPDTIDRICGSFGVSRDQEHRLIAASLCVSADMAHAVHPNYADRHEARHKPVLNGGPVIKVNSQQRYATSGEGAALFQSLCRKADVPVQFYAHRTDLPCGSTIGPITATLMGIRTIDVGNPMLSMHSIRELAGSRDPALMVRAMSAFYSELSAI